MYVFLSVFSFLSVLRLLVVSGSEDQNFVQKNRFFDNWRFLSKFIVFTKLYATIYMYKMLDLSYTDTIFLDDYITIEIIQWKDSFRTIHSLTQVVCLITWSNLTNCYLPDSHSKPFRLNRSYISNIKTLRVTIKFPPT